jgi:hypothetical protein
MVVCGVVVGDQAAVVVVVCASSPGGSSSSMAGSLCLAVCVCVRAGNRAGGQIKRRCELAGTFVSLH